MSKKRFKGRCPDFTEECRTKLGVYVCWVSKHKDYECPIMDHDEGEERHGEKEKRET